MLTGDAIAHEIGRSARGLADWARTARQSLGRSLNEYLTYETGAVVSPLEVEEFCAGVDALAQGVDRLEARLHQLKNSD